MFGAAPLNHGAESFADYDTKENHAPCGPGVDCVDMDVFWVSQGSIRMHMTFAKWSVLSDRIIQ